MRYYALALACSSVLLLTVAGCVERKMLIRSEPAGAPVWLDETYAGVTPLELSFPHYGMRGVRIGPLRNAEGVITYQEQVVNWEVESPWYETFPIDFFFEVLYPKTLVDLHEMPVVVLPAQPDTSAETPEAADARVQALVKRAGEFREKALSGMPEEVPALPEEGK